MMLIQLFESTLMAEPALSRFFSSEIAQTAGATLVTAIWQGAIVALCVAGALKIARRTTQITAALRFTIWVAGFATAICLPFWSLLWRRLAVHASFPASVNTSAGSPSWIQIDFRWSIALAILWSVASIYRAADLAFHAARLRALWKEAKPVAPEKLNPDLIQLLEGSRRRIKICTTIKQDRPGVIGFFAPRILIPEWLLDLLTPAELTQIVIHETEHIRRGDDWTNLLQKLGLIVFPLNPALLWMDRRLCVEREMACDEAVVRATRAPRAYAACLTNLAEHGRVWRHQAMERAALTLGAWRRRSELVGRVHSILRSKSTSDFSVGKMHSRSIFAVLACGLMIGSVELSRCPQLVSFAPTQKEPIAAAQVRPGQNARHNMPPVAQTMGGTIQTVSTRSLGLAHMTKLKAIVTASDSSFYPAYSDIPASKANPRWKPTPATIREVVPTHGKRSLEQADNTSSNANLTAEMDAPSPMHSISGPIAQDQQEGWLVLTTWEEIATTDSPQRIGASEQIHTDGSQTAPAMESAAMDGSSASSAQQPTQQIRVTRVVFRVVPANFVSPAPHLAQTRDGWLVLQL